MQRKAEPAFNVPGPVLLLFCVLIGAFLLQTLTGLDAWNARFGFTPESIAQGQWLGLVTYMVAHASWFHVGSNALGVLAFGAPPSRHMGTDLLGGLMFFAFFLITGVFSALSMVFIYWGSDTLVVGASGGVFGLIGAATRMLHRRHGLAPLFSRETLVPAGMWIGVNAMIGLVGSPLMGGGVRVAWEAHIAGLLLGLVLIGPWLRLRRGGIEADTHSLSNIDLDDVARSDPTAEKVERPPERKAPRHRPGPWG